tara:strand:+ start:835 stop:2379 length:1545 start_codon:yes stop_codon:yes gene_type:complete
MNKNILFTDIVGYSKLTGDDQSLAIELLGEHDKIIEPIIIRYQGTIVKRIGDAIVAIFDDTKKMIQTSIEIQQSLKNRNNRNIKSRKLILRIGLHYGTILIQDQEIHGVGYDLASEIEPICEYGGIAISDAVYSQSHENNELIVKGVNNHFFIHPIAKFNFKSHSKPVLVYKLYLNLLDWYDELYSEASEYLADQHIGLDKYNITNINVHDAQSLDNHLVLADSFLNEHNLSYAIYHYKMYLDYCKDDNYAIELKILKIFAECGLIRLVNKALSKISIEQHSVVALVHGINLLNQKRWDDSINQLEFFLDADNSEFLIDGLYYLTIALFKKQYYGRIIELVDSKKEYIEESKFHFLITNTIKEIALSQLSNNKSTEEVITLYSSLEHELSSIKQLNQQKYLLFLYYPLIVFYQNHITIEQAINIQNKAIKLIKKSEAAISGFLLRQLFLKSPLLHQMIMEPLELEFVNDEGLDEYDLDDILTEQKESSKFCTSCGTKNSIKFQFCIACGKKLVV